jgi:hypothetical protein
MQTTKQGVRELTRAPMEPLMGMTRMMAGSWTMNQVNLFIFIRSLILDIILPAATPPPSLPSPGRRPPSPHTSVPTTAITTMPTTTFTSGPEVLTSIMTVLTT